MQVSSINFYCLSPSSNESMILHMFLGLVCVPHLLSVCIGNLYLNTYSGISTKSKLLDSVPLHCEKVSQKKSIK